MQRVTGPVRSGLMLHYKQILIRSVNGLLGVRVWNWLPRLDSNQ